MQWLLVNSICDLKKLGKFKAVKAEIQVYFSKSIQIKARGWNDLFIVISKLQSLINTSLSPEKEQESLSSNSYFKSEAVRYIYALTKLSGEAQLKEIGLNRIHFRNTAKAKDLRNKIAHKIHPDKCNHPEAEDAMNELTKLFKEVVS
jgi:hypothetical protein